MNVFFHVTTAIGIVAIVTDTNKIQSARDTIIPALSGFLMGLVIHGVLDYMPHCYPFAAKVDMIISLLIIIIAFVLANKKYYLIWLFSFLGSVFPDIIDLLPSILDKYLNLNLSISEKVFPWHWNEYSGSIFTGQDTVSDINHLLVIVVTFVVCWCRRSDLKQMFMKEKRLLEKSQKAR